jgi:hypothetical protein
VKKEIKPNPQDSKTQDADSVAESIQEKPKTAPSIDFEDDYELAKKMSKGDDKTEVNDDEGELIDSSESLSS